MEAEHTFKFSGCLSRKVYFNDEEFTELKKQMGFNDLLEALQAVYADLELQNVKGGSDELNIMVQKALAKGEGK